MSRATHLDAREQLGRRRGLGDRIAAIGGVDQLVVDVPCGTWRRSAAYRHIVAAAAGQPDENFDAWPVPGTISTLVA